MKVKCHGGCEVANMAGNTTKASKTTAPTQKGTDEASTKNTTSKKVEMKGSDLIQITLRRDQVGACAIAMWNNEKLQKGGLIPSTKKERKLTRVTHEVISKALYAPAPVIPNIDALSTLIEDMKNSIA